MTERRPLILRADTAPPRLQELPAGDLLSADTLGNALKVLLQGLVTGNNAGITPADTVLQALGKLQAQASAKVDKDGAKVLSDNNFTNAERVKLANVAEAATKNLSDAVLLSRQNHSGTQPLSTISDAGTAASRNVQGSQVDGSVGSVLIVGAFGLGRLLSVNAMDVNNTNQFPTGLASYYITAATGLPSGVGNGYLVVSKYDDSYLTQTFTHYSSGNVYKRTREGGAWIGGGAWRLVSDSSSAVGPIATGSIIERGANSNGEYVKFADGTAMAWGYRTGYVAGDNYTTTPIAFLGTGGASMSVIPSAGWQTPVGWYANNSSFVFNMPVANASNAYTFFVIGRWK